MSAKINSPMAKPTTYTQNAARACFHVSNLLVMKLKLFSDGEIVKECMDILVENICPEKKLTVCQYIDVSADISLAH